MPFTDKEISYMQQSLNEARLAAEGGDVPVGAVIVKNDTGEIIARGHNTREQQGSALGHAEITAIDEACKAMGGWRLSDCTLYITLEPCPMCAGAIVAARIPRVICGAKDPVAGAMGSVWAIHRNPLETSSHVEITYGCMEGECRAMLQAFFKRKRER